MPGAAACWTPSVPSVLLHCAWSLPPFHLPRGWARALSKGGQPKAEDRHLKVASKMKTERHIKSRVEFFAFMSNFQLGQIPSTLAMPLLLFSYVSPPHFFLSIKAMRRVKKTLNGKRNEIYKSSCEDCFTYYVTTLHKAFAN